MVIKESTKSKYRFLHLKAKSTSFPSTDYAIHLKYYAMHGKQLYQTYWIFKLTWIRSRMKIANLHNFAQVKWQYHFQISMNTKITFLWGKSIICITAKYLFWNSPINSYESFCKLWSIELLNGLEQKQAAYMQVTSEHK